MKNISKILIMLIVASMALLVGCGGGGGGGGSDTPTGKIAVSGDVEIGTSNMTFYVTCPSTYSNLKVSNPIGYTVNYVSNTKYKVVGPVIDNPSSSVIYKTFTFSYLIDGNSKTENVIVSIPPSVEEVEISVTNPKSKYGDAYNLKWSSTNHLVSVKVDLTEGYKSKSLDYIWHKDSENGTVIYGSDDEYESAEFIYRPQKTDVIPADVTTGITRKYNRGFKINSYLVSHYVYLVIKTSDGVKLGTLKFYVDEPTTPPTP